MIVSFRVISGHVLMNFMLRRIQNHLRFLPIVAICLSVPVSAQEQEWSRFLKAGNEARIKKQFPEAEKAYLAAVVEAEKLDPQDESLAMCLMTLGTFYSMQARQTDAKNAHARAVSVLEKLPGSESASL